MVIDKELIHRLHLEACKSERLRINYDLRDSDDEISLRLLTVMEPMTNVPIHRHKDTSEVLFLVSGKIEERFYDNDGSIIARFVLSADGDARALIVPKGQWHNLIVLEECSAIVECRRGPYVPTSKEDIMI